MKITINLLIFICVLAYIGAFIFWLIEESSIERLNIVIGSLTAFTAFILMVINDK